MEIISHRGFWKTKNEQNTKIAFNRAFEYGFGIETDIRDYNGYLVISHDIPNNNSMKLEDFFANYNYHKSKSWLALNIKSDGLQKELYILINKFNIKNYFVFDMSIPDSISYLNDFNLFCRQSEYEQVVFYNKIQGVWLDSFKNDWIRQEDILKHIQNDKKVCIVSPELHQRDYNLVWEKYLNCNLIDNENFMICTDYPDKFQLLTNKI